MIKIGAHVSAAVSLERAFDKAREIGADCVQIFIAPPQQWMKTQHSDEEIATFRRIQEERGIGPNFIHGTYLINLGTGSEEHLARSIDWLVYAMDMAGRLGMRGVIFHLGSHKGVGFEKVLGQIGESFKRILEKVPRVSRGKESKSQRVNESKPLDTLLILETSAGAGGGLGGTFRELGEILKQVQDDRLKVCIDTQHIFAAGYDIKTPIGLKDVLEEFDQEIGLNNLAAIHANDSKTEYKSGRDRHENIGEGFIGREGFEGLINHPALQDVPFILEVPGLTGNGPDKENVELLKSLIK